MKRELSKKHEEALIKAGILRPVSKSFGPLHKEDNIGPRKSKKQKESVLQNEIIKLLHYLGLGFFFRIRNGATFDPTVGRYRSNTGIKGIPDILGVDRHGRAVFIEVKFQRTRKRKDGKLVEVKAQISREQKDVLLRAEKFGASAGIAYNADDAVDIVKRQMRHPRTFHFKDIDWIKSYKEEYAEWLHEEAEKKKDPFYRDVIRANKNIIDPDSVS